MNNKMQNDRPLSIGGLRRRKGLCRFLASVAAAMFLFVSTAPAFADPTSVLGGNAVLTGMARATLDANDANAAVFSSSSASAVLDWSKFNIGSGQSMGFNGASTTFFNLVDGAAGKSQIDGIINGSGNVWVINPAGIAFGASSSVNVGGLFAAAAGNIENAAALRDGTAMTPAFSSFAGTVDVPGGTFSADRIALLGKTVTVDGADMKNVGHLAIGAGDAMTVVDNVGEGKVTINITDFADDPTETSVNLGDLDLGGGVDYGYGTPFAERGLYVRGGNGIKVTGEVNTDGNAEFYTKNGDITVAETGAVNANGIMGEVDLIAGMDENGKGDVVVGGLVSADTDWGYGAIYAYAGYGLGGAGSKGDLKVGGSVVAGDMVDAQSFAGDAKVGVQGGIQALYGQTSVAASDSVRVDGVVSSSGMTTVSAYGKGVTVGQTGTVQATGEGATVKVVSAYDEGTTGDIKIEGAVGAANKGDVFVSAGYGGGSKGNLEIGGSVTAANAMELDAAGDVTGAGSIMAAGAQLDVNAGGKIELEGVIKGARTELNAVGDIKAANTGNDITGQLFAEGASVIVKDADAIQLGNVTAKGGDVQISTQSGDLEVVSGKTVQTLAEGGTVALLAGREDYMGVDGSVVVNGTVKADVKDGSVCLYGGNGHLSTGGVTVNGKVSAVAEGSDTASSVDIVSGFGMYSSGDIVIASGGEVVSDGAVSADAGFGYGYGYLAESAGNVVVDGVVKGEAGVSIVSEDGNVSGSGSVNAGSGALTATACTGDIDFGQVDVKAGDADFIAAGVIKADCAQNDFGGRVTADGLSVKIADANDVVFGDVSAYAGDVSLMVVNGKATVDGAISGVSSSKIYTGSGDIVVNVGASVGTVAADGHVDIAAGVLTAGAGTLSVNGDVSAASVVELSGKDGVDGSGSIDATGGFLSLSSDGGAVKLTGQVVSKDVAFSAKGDVEMSNIKNDFTGFLGGSGKSVVVKDANALKLADVTATGGDVQLSTQSGDIMVAAGKTVQTLAEGGTVALLAGREDYTGVDGSVIVNGSVKADVKGGAVCLYGGYGHLSTGGVTVNGKVSATADEGASGIDLVSGFGMAASGDIVIASGGEVVSDGEINFSAGYGYGYGWSFGAFGNISVAGQVLGGSKASLVTSSGSIGITSSGLVASTADGSSVNLAAAHDEGSSGDVVIGGSVGSVGKGGMALISAGTGDDNASSVYVGGLVSADGTVAVSAEHYAVMTEGSQVGSASDDVLMDATGGISVYGDVLAAKKASLRSLGSSVDVLDNGYVRGGESVLLDGQLGVGNSGVIDAQGAVLTVDAHVGPAILDALGQFGNGMVLAKDATFVSDVMVSAANPANAITGTLSVDAPIVNLMACGSLTLRDLFASGGLSIALAGGDLNVAGRVRANGLIALTADKGAVNVLADGSLTAFGPESAIALQGVGVNVAGAISAESVAILADRGASVDGSVAASRETILMAGGDVSVAGSISGGVSAEIIAGGSVSVHGRVSSGEVTLVDAGGSADIRGTVRGGADSLVLTEGGDVTVSGSVVANRASFIKSAGDVRFTSTGSLSGGESASVIAKGNLSQEDASIPFMTGREGVYSLRPSVSAPEISLQIGGDIGHGAGEYVAVDGKVYVVGFGNVSLAAAYGKSLRGGNASSVESAIDSAQYSIQSSRKMIDGTLTLEEAMARLAKGADFDDNALYYSSGNMFLYTAGNLDANSLVRADGNLTVSASTFGDMSYLQAGGTLTINNVGHPSHPQIAYFESVNGREPRINNQPNDMVIFIDGRLAGGNLQIINKFGATEAFPVSTPELKSEQGIFGNPVFLHGDLDVANPMAVGNVDYMLQEIPRLTLASDFPLEVDKSVNTAGLNPKDVYRFGQHPQVAEEKPQAEQEEKKDDKASAEKSAEPKVAMR